MLSENEIINRFRKHGLFRGNELYLAVPIALDFLAACQENNFAIIGIEGFIYHEEQNAIEAKLDYIADYSDVKAPNWEAYRDLCNQLAKAFLCHLPKRPDLLVNFVVREEEWPLPGPRKILVPLSVPAAESKKDQRQSVSVHRRGV